MRITVDTINDFLMNGGMVTNPDEVQEKYTELGIDVEPIARMIIPFLGEVAAGCFLAGLALGIEMYKKEVDPIENELQQLIEETENGS